MHWEPLVYKVVDGHVICSGHRPGLKELCNSGACVFQVVLPIAADFKTEVNFKSKLGDLLFPFKVNNLTG